jgi:hypothetical protein
LPVRNGKGNAAAPPNGTVAGDSAEPRTPPGPAAPGGPSRLPAFTGLNPQAPPSPQAGPQFPIGSQNVHGSDGPSASDAASAANGLPGAGGPGADPSAGDAAGDSGQVTIPPAGHEQRLPIFDSLESDWFRRSGKTLTSAPRPQGAPAAQSARASSWTSPADEGWRAAQAVAAPAAGETTQAGLPRRVPRANLVPGSVGSGGQDTGTEAPARSPDVARTRMASFQRGVREGRAAAPQSEEP